MATAASRSGAAARPSPIQMISTIVGAAFLLVGVLGFIPGITQNMRDIDFAGPDSPAELLGIFQVSVLHNVAHLLIGVLGLAAGRVGTAAARNFLVGAGALYLVLWVYGLAVDEASDANFVPLNTADNWLHFALGAAMVALGLAASGAGRARRAPGPAAPSTG